MTSSDAALHRIEALPGRGRYAVSFTRPDGAEHAAVATVTEAGSVDVAEAALPTGWRHGSAPAAAMAAAVLAFDAARRSVAAVKSLTDVDGGWDVSLGNVVLGDAGRPTCTAHGALEARGEVFVCAECGAQAAFA